MSTSGREVRIEVPGRSIEVVLEVMNAAVKFAPSITITTEVVGRNQAGEPDHYEVVIRG